MDVEEPVARVKREETDFQATASRCFWLSQAFLPCKLQVSVFRCKEGGVTNDI